MPTASAHQGCSKQQSASAVQCSASALQLPRAPMCGFDHVLFPETLSRSVRLLFLLCHSWFSRSSFKEAVSAERNATRALRSRALPGEVMCISCPAESTSCAKNLGSSRGADGIFGPRDGPSAPHPHTGFPWVTLLHDFFVCLFFFF